MIRSQVHWNKITSEVILHFEVSSPTSTLFLTRYLVKVKTVTVDVDHFKPV